MSKLTTMQKLVRPVINFLVERYFPSGLFFYGSGPLSAFDRLDAERGRGMGSMAAMSLARHASNLGASRISVDAEGLTANHEDLGDWRVTVERITPAGRAALANGDEG